MGVQDNPAILLLPRQGGLELLASFNNLADEILQSVSTIGPQLERAYLSKLPSYLKSAQSNLCPLECPTEAVSTQLE